MISYDEFKDGVKRALEQKMGLCILRLVRLRMIRMWLL